MSTDKLFSTTTDQNPFSKVPIEILYIFLSFLPSFKELGRMACVSKIFNNLITNNDEQLYKEISIRIWNEDENLKPVKSYLRKLPIIGDQNILEWVRKVMVSFNLVFSWKWIAQCIQRCDGLEHTCGFASEILQIGSFNTTIVNLYTYSASFSGAVEIMYIPLKKINGILEEGIIVYANGSTYQGENYMFTKHGKGIYTYSRGSIKYVGEFNNDLFHGIGTLIWKDGFSITTKWHYGTPIESMKNELMHPTLKERVKRGLCTTGKGNQEHGQPMWRCIKNIDCMNILLCATCQKHSHKYSNHEHEFEYCWSSNIKCECKEEHCKYE